MTDPDPICCRCCSGSPTPSNAWRPAPAPPVDLDAADAFVWHADRGWLEPVGEVNRVEIGLLRGIDRVRDILLDNTRRFAAGLPANNVLLWGARGTGKSSLVKAAHAAVNAERPHALALVEIHREDIPSLPHLLSLVRPCPRRCLLFCDDLSFDQHDTSFKSLKAVLEGGIEGRPDERRPLRHLEPPPSDAARHDRQRALDRDQPGRGGRGAGLAVGPVRAVARLSQCRPGHLSRDRARLCRALRARICRPTQLKAEANEWSITRGARSGRVAWQFIQDLAGRLGKPLA